MRGFKILTFFLLSTTTFLGCSNSRQSFGQQGNIGIVDSGSRSHIDSRVLLTLADFKAFAENVTTKMMTSTLVRGWGSKRPKLVLGHIENNTYDDNLRMEDVYDQIQEVILNSGLVRVVDVSALSFDYIVKTTMTENRQSNASGQKLVSYTLQLKMFTVDGELVGQWSDDLTMAKAAKPLF